MDTGFHGAMSDYEAVNIAVKQPLHPHWMAAVIQSSEVYAQQQMLRYVVPVLVAKLLVTVALIAIFG
jgi:hypothetical protein